MNLKKYLAWPYLLYLRFWAKLSLKINQPKVIGITGSAGKSSLKQTVYSALHPSLKTKMIKKGNSETGIPLGILGLEVKNYSFKEWMKLAFSAPFGLPHLKSTEYLIIEMGIDDPYPPKNMDYLLSIVKPDISVLLNVLPVHTMQFEKVLTTKEHQLSDHKKEQILINAIAQQKAQILTAPSQEGTVIYPKNFFYRDKIKDRIKAKQIAFNPKPDPSQWQVSKQGTKITIHHQNKEYQLDFPQYALPQYYQTTLKTAFLVALQTKLEPKTIVQNIQNNLNLPPGRASLIKGVKNSLIIDSSYNSSLQPLLGMLKLQDKLKNSKRKVAVLGDMRELGKQAKKQHQAAAEKAVQTADEIILVGPLMRQYFLPHALDLGFPENKLHHLPSAAKAAKFLKETIKNKDLILVKGSQNTIFLEIVIKKIMANPEKADQLLCRQSQYWKNLKSSSRSI
jgi:UDP-N-acetylmuramoyl-tripeptide--D-alanyl-D-alanine ligase